MEMLIAELRVLSVCRDPVAYANKAYDKIASLRESGKITGEQAEIALEAVYRHLWEVL